MTRAAAERAQAVAYVRLSIDRTGKAPSIESQLEICRTLADRYNVEIVTELVDRDESASQFRRKNYKRPGWEQTLQGLKDGRWTVVLAPDWDRGSREGIVGLAEVIQAMPRNGRFVTDSFGELDLSTSQGRMLASIIAEQAAAYSEAVSRKTRIARAREASQGVYPKSGTRLYSRTIDGELIPEEAAVLKEVAARILPPKRESVRSICRDLNERKVPTVQGVEWFPVTLTRCLRSPIHAGLRVHTDKEGNTATYPGQWEALWDVDHLAALEAAISTKKTKHSATGRYDLSLLTASMIRCGRCGQGLRPTTGSKSKNQEGPGPRKYGCVAGPGRPGCGRLSVSLDKLEAFLGEKICTPTEWGVGLPGSNGNGKKSLAQLEADLEADKEARSKLTADYYSRRLPLTEADFLAAYNELTETIERLEREQERTLSQQPADTALLPPVAGLEAALEWWKAKSPEERREVAEAAFLKITVNPSTLPTGSRFDSNRVAISWKPTWIAAIREKLDQDHGQWESVAKWGSLLTED